jgi:hypothetical protein
MGNIDSRNERFYNLCGLGKAHLIEKMLENDRTFNTINIDWIAFETQSTPLLIVRYISNKIHFIYSIEKKRLQLMVMILLLMYFFEIMPK